MNQRSLPGKNYIYQCKINPGQCVILAVVLIATCAANSRADDSPILANVISPPEGGNDVFSFGPEKEIAFHSQNVKAEANWVPIEGMPFSHAYRVESDTRSTKAWFVRVHIPLDKQIRKGDVVLMSFWMRRPESDTRKNQVQFFVDTKPNESGYRYKLSAFKPWQQHVRSFVANNDFSTSQGGVRFYLGEAGKVAEIADLRLVNYGQDFDAATLPRSTVMYSGREKDAQWRKEALARIEQIRKAELAVHVIDAEGQPIPSAKVNVAMRQHEFGFGNAVNSEILGADQSDFPINPKKQIEVSWEEAQKYRQVVKNYFDRVTFESELRPHVWKGLKGESVFARRKHGIFFNKTLPWLIDNNINVRGHYLAWAPMDFNSVEKKFVGSPEDHRKWLWEHMADVLPTTNEYVTEWDTINHIIGWGKHTYEIEYGGPEIYSEIMAEARRLAPDATHAINEGKVLPDGYKREPYKKIIRFLNEQGQAPDLVGFMAHFDTTTMTTPEDLLQVYDEFAEIAPRLQLSEFDVDAGDDEELQADYFRDVMIASFSHPNFEAICQWGFWEKMHWKPGAALWREDWSLKPSGEVFVDLVANQWWTDEMLTTDKEGQCQTRGFLGDYLITVQHNGETKTVPIKLTREGAMVRAQLP